jgi:hypothetical protein
MKNCLPSFQPYTYRYLRRILASKQSLSATTANRSHRDGRRRDPQRCTAVVQLAREHVRFFDTARVPCDHEYCRDCLRDLFQASMTDDSLFPPRCCRQLITASGVRIFLTTDLIKQYEQKKVELETPDRTYCSNPLCSAFIHPKDITNEQASCPDCGAIACTLCKASSHGRLPCRYSAAASAPNGR